MKGVAGLTVTQLYYLCSGLNIVPIVDDETLKKKMQQLLKNMYAIGSSIVKCMKQLLYVVRI